MGLKPSGCPGVSFRGLLRPPAASCGLCQKAAHKAQAKAWAFFSEYTKPFLCAFADNDPVTGGGDQPFLEKVPGTKGQAHTTITDGGHFVQEGNPQQLCQVIGDFIRANPTN